MEEKKNDKVSLDEVEKENATSIETKVETPSKKDKKKNQVILILTVVAVVLAFAVVGVFVGKNILDNKKEGKGEVDSKEVFSKYKMSGNGLEDFDLSFLQLENKEQNMIYSPLSIKYALEMLGEGANGNTKAQIDAVIGAYKAKKYNNSPNMSLANALFVRDSYQENIEEEYRSKLTTKYNADVIFDTFANATTVNGWVKEKTLGLISELVTDSDLNDLQYILINSLGIDMEWKNVIQSIYVNEEYKGLSYSVSYPHTKYSASVETIMGNFPSLDFSNNTKVKSSCIGATINNYDFLKEQGEDNIRNKVTEEYEKFVANDECGYNSNGYGTYEETTTVVNRYMKQLKEGYGYKDVKFSTDFSYYDDETVKLFAKDLKEYDGTTLQYIGVMPKQGNLKDFIANMKASKVNELIGKLKTIELENFEYGKIYRIQGLIPLFQFEYQLNLLEDLKKLGITDVFEDSKADLSKLSKEHSYVGYVAHKANIDFSNEGIKASAVTGLGGYGAAHGCEFEYLWDLPVEEIDLNFDHPYFFLIRDKSSGEVWFSGTVYQPTEWKNEVQF